MNKRSERATLSTADMRDGDYDEEARAERAENDERPAPSPGAKGLSTTDMAAAMQERAGSNAATGPKRPDANGRQTPLFAGNESEAFRSRWTEIQTGFVDEPRQAVEHADGLVAEVVQRLTQTFADERNHLEQQWGKGDDVSTEDLRLALQRYRSFFERLLST